MGWVAEPLADLPAGMMGFLVSSPLPASATDEPRAVGITAQGGGLLPITLSGRGRAAEVGMGSSSLLCRKNKMWAGIGPKGRNWQWESGSQAVLRICCHLRLTYCLAFLHAGMWWGGA